MWGQGPGWRPFALALSWTGRVPVLAFSFACAHVHDVQPRRLRPGTELREVRAGRDPRFDGEARGLRVRDEQCLGGAAAHQGEGAGLEGAHGGG